MFLKKNIIDALFIILFMTTILVGSLNTDEFGSVSNTEPASVLNQKGNSPRYTPLTSNRVVVTSNSTLANSTLHKEANCFYDSVHNMIHNLEYAVQFYLKLCSLNNKPRLAQLVEIARKLGFAEGFTNSSNMTNDVSSAIKTLDQHKDFKFNTYLKELRKSIEENVARDKIVERVWLSIGDELDDIVRKDNYPFFLRKNMWILMQNIRIVNTLQAKYCDDLEECLPNTWDNIINIYEISSNPNFVTVYKPHKQICKVDAQVIAVEPEYFTNGGIAITFWGTENLATLNGKQKNVFSGYLDNKLLYEYTLIPQKDQVLHQFKILDKFIMIKSNSKCSDYFFVMLSIQKDCDKYKLIYSVRFLASNTRQSGQAEIFADKIENTNFIFDKTLTFANNMYRNFLYTSDKELLLMSYSVDKNLLVELTKKAVCLPNCDYSDAGKCILCPVPKVNIDGKCAQNCPDSFYNDGKGLCKPCAVQCNGCTGPLNGDCKECSMKLFLNDGKCVPRCPENMASNPKGRCVKCDVEDRCKICKDDHTCAKCAPEFFLKKGKCEPSCGKGYYRSYQPNECIQCKVGCEECSSALKCEVCEKGFFMKEGLCVPNCGDKYFGDAMNRKCVNCTKGCRVCVNADKCIECEKGLLLSTEGICVNTCSKGSVNIAGVCVPCKDKNCDLCNPVDTSQCKICSSSSFLKSGKCVDVCGDHFYVDKNRECQPCSKGCQICNSEKCLKCDFPLVIFKDTQCVAECVEGYVKSGNVCIKCTDPLCKRCDPKMLNVCTVCYADKFLHFGKCLPTCPIRYFVKGLNCEECSKGCDKCENDSECLVCSNDFFLKNHHCVDCCGTGFTEVGKECQECKVSGCDICTSSNLDKCEKCADNKILYNNQCLKNCPLGTFLNSAGGCDECAHDCAICNNKETCEECKAGKFLQGRICQSLCDSNFIPINRKCVACLNLRCKKCDINLTKCTECPVGSNLYKNDCINVCPYGTYESSGTCLDCVKPCLECSKADKCSSCVKGFLLVNERCSDNCLSNQGAVNGVCKPCTQKECNKCASDLSTCMECSDPSVLHLGKCLPVCLPGFFALKRECKPCIAGCKSCKDTLTCSVCNDGLFLKEGKCVPTCGTGYVLNEKSKSCLQCNAKCLNCSKDDVNYCTECSAPYFLYQGDCKPSCPNMTFATVKKTCEPCATKNCNKCTGGLTCTDCIKGLVLEENKCIPAPCSKGYVQNGDLNICLKCEVEHCEKCSPKDLKSCEKCTSLLYLVGNNKCRPDCPVGTFKNNATFKCDPCLPHCDKCANDKQCNECEENFFLFDGKCEKTCPDGYTKNLGKCVPCEVKGCKTCPSSKICVLCTKGDVLDENKCIPSCPLKKFDSDGRCLDCAYGCEDCCDNKTCNQCVKEKFETTDGKCLDACPIGTVSINGKCVKCQTEKNCKKCDDKNLKSCIICEKGMVLKNGICVDKCGDSFFNEGGNCKPCGIRCKSCVDLTHCQVCDNGFLLDENVCVPKCPSGKYPFLGKCSKCTDRCAFCNSDKCIRCDKGTFLENGKCVTYCTKGNFPDVDVCKECDCDCADCISLDTCKLCNSGKVLKNGKCEAECGLGYVEKSGVCAPCDLNCNKCSKLNPNECTECKDKFVLYQGKCRDKCPISTYLFKGECKQCTKGCDVCDDKVCIKCTPPLFLSPDNKSCIVVCPDGYKPGVGLCAPCEVIECKNCNSNVKACDECKLPGILLDKKCTPICPSVGHYKTKDGKRCNKCPVGCNTCTEDKCITCSKGFAIKDGKCVNNCDKGEVMVDGRCDKCKSDKCEVCDSSAKNCLKCIPGYMIETDSNGNKVCTDCCGDKMFNNNGVCDKCVEHCEECVNGKECALCEKGFVLQGGQCQVRCDKFFIEKDFKCERCEDLKCINCDPATKKICKVCDTYYYLKKDVCVNDCGTGFFKFEVNAKDRYCKPCKKNCDNCTNGEVCLNCAKGFVLKVNECVAECGKGWTLHKDKNICVQCISLHCAYCDTNNADNCLTCEPGYFLKDGQCVKSCGENYVAEKEKCLPCSDINCLTCSPKNNCLKCKTPFNILKGDCVKTCPDGMAVKNGECVSCGDKNCIKCHPESLNQCLECKKGFLIDTKLQCTTKCGEGEFIFQNTKCKPCGGNCLNCLNEKECFECNKGFVLDVDKKCTDKCSDGSVMIAGKCAPCSDKSCSKCSPTNLKICTDCKKGNFLYKGVCVPKCPLSTFVEGTTCQPCSDNCEVCTSAKKCDKCSKDSVLQGDYCVKQCDEGYNNVSGVCVKCKDFDKVSKCLIGREIECRKNLFLHYNSTNSTSTNTSLNRNASATATSNYTNINGTCYYVCPQGSFPDITSKKCIQCGGNCLECSNPKTCDKCSLTRVKHLGECVEKCPKGYIDLKGECTPCTSKVCNVCSIQNLDNCLECSGKLVLNMKGQCVPTCEEGTFLEGLKCQLCDATCQTCTERNKCTTCKPQFSKDGFKCVSSCEPGFVSIDGNCIACADKDCLICSSKNINECLKCKSKILFEKLCVEKCPVGYRLDLETSQCVACSKNCNTCDEKGCTECTKGFFPSETDKRFCVNCQDISQVVEKGICKKCKPENCLRCKEGNSEKCRICHISTVLYKGKCLKVCPSGFYRKGQSCFPCALNCQACQDGVTCDECKKPNILLDGKCVALCPLGYVYDGKTKCDKCVQSECGVCDKNQKDCLKCTPPSILYNKLCYNICPDGTYHKDNTCSPCNKGCEACTPTQCIKCVAGLKLKENDCVKDCGKGFVDAGDKCNHCTDSHCDKCDTESNCKDCAAPYFLNEAGSCVLECKKGTYNDIPTKSCKICNKGCEECKKDGECTVCDKGLFLYNGKCILICPDGFAPGEAKCAPCEDKECKKCGKDNGTCDECKGANFLLNTKCVPKCPPGYFTKLGRCHKCDTKCDLCRSFEVCDKCKPEFNLIDGKCDTNCADGKVNVNGKCIPCLDVNCKNCLSNIKECAVCEKPYVLSDKKCLIACPKGQYSDINGNCKPCGAGCQNCKGPDACTECDDNWYLFKDHCVKVCPLGFYGECKERVCHKCNEACEVCTDSTPTNCKHCSKDYFLNTDTCVKSVNCGDGTFPDTLTNQCAPCKLPYCSECSNSKTCDQCMRGYVLEKGVCVEAKSFFNVVPSSSRLFSQHTYGSKTQKLSFNTYLKGTGIGSDSVTFSFFLRDITSKLTDITTDIFETTSVNASQTIKFTIDNGKCNILIGTEKYQLGDCNYDTNTYNWKYFNIILKRKGEKGSVLIYSKEYNSPPSTKSFDFIMSKSAQFVNKDSNLVFNNAKQGNAFELSQFNVLDYSSDHNETIKFSKTFPSDCDYSCADCQEKCNMCPSNVEPDKNGLCPAVYIPIMKDYHKISSLTSILLESKITKRLHSVRYGIVTWFYSQSQEMKDSEIIVGKLFYNYNPATPILVASYKNGYLSVSIDGKNFSYPKLTIRPNNWYHIKVMVENDMIKITLQVRNGIRSVNTERIATHTRRLTEEVTFNLGDSKTNQFIGSVYEYRLYVNRSPEEEEVTAHYNSLKCDKNCLECNVNMRCMKCKDGYNLNINNICVDDVLGAPIVGLDKYSFFNRESSTIKLPPKFEKLEIFSFSFFYRKKIHSLDGVNPNSFNVLSFVSKGKSYPLVRETLLPNYQSQFSLSGESQKNPKTFEEDFNNQIYTFIHFVVNINLATDTIHITTKNGEINLFGDLTVEHIDNFVFGDKNGQEMNFEIGSAYFYEKILEKDNISKVKLTEPKDCDPSCKKCDYVTGNCLECASRRRGISKVCGNFLIGYKSGFLFNAFKIDKAKANLYSIRLRDTFSRDVNSDEYSVIGYFKLFDKRRINKYENNRFTLFTVSNRSIKTKISPSNNLISLEIRTVKSKAYYNWVLNDGNNVVETEIEGITVLEDEWLFIYATVNVQQKKLSFAFQREIPESKAQVGEIIFKNYPERLQEKSTMILFGIGLQQSKEYKLVNGNFHNFYLSPNLKWNTSMVYKYRMAYPAKKDPKCEDNCSQCVFDYVRVISVCLVCNVGYNLNNEKCLPSNKSDYVLLSDQKAFFYLPPRTDFKLPQIVSGLSRNTLAFYIQRNYMPKNLKDNRIILTADTLTVSSLISQVGGSSLFFQIKGESDSITISGLDEDITVDYSFYLVLVQYSSNYLKVIVEDSEKKKVLNKAIKLNSPFTIHNLSFNSLNTELTIYGPHILLNNSYSAALFGFPPSFCSVNCNTCVEGICVQCQYGFDENKRCNNRPVKTGNFLVGYDKSNRFILGSVLSKVSNLRSKSWSIYFTFEIDQDINELVGKTLLRIQNNIDTNYDANSLNDNIFSIRFNKNRSFFLTISNRNYLSRLKTPMGYTTASFKDSFESKIFFVGISLDDDNNQLNILIINTNQIIKESFDIEGVTENINLHTTLVFGEGIENSKPKLIIENTRFFYERYQSFDFLKLKANKYLTRYQNACGSNARLSCLICKFGFLVNGICTPYNFIYNWLTNEIKHIDECEENIIAPNKIPVKNLNLLTYSFWYKRTSYSTGINGLVRIKNGTNDLVSVTNDANVLVIQVFNSKGMQSNGLRLPLLYEKTDGLTWQYIAVSLNIKENIVQVFNYNHHSKTNRLLTNHSKIDLNASVMSELTLELAFNEKEIKSSYSYDISEFVFSQDYFPKDTADYELYKIRLPRDCESNCAAKCDENNLCRPQDRFASHFSFKDFNIAEPLDSYMSVPLFKNAKTYFKNGDNYHPSFTNYLIAFEIDLAKYFTSNYSTNKNILINVNNERSNEDLKYSDIIPDNLIKYGVVSVEIRENALRFYIGGNLPNTYIAFYDFVFESNNFKGISKLNVELVVDGDHKMAYLVVYVDDLKVFFEIKFAYTPLPINEYTNFFNHPNISNLRFDFVHPRFNTDYQDYLMNNQQILRSFPSNLCQSKDNCLKCSFVKQTSSINCDKCREGYKMINNMCLRDKSVNTVK